MTSLTTSLRVGTTRQPLLIAGSLFATLIVLAAFGIILDLGRAIPAAVQVPASIPVAPIESDYLREISASWGTAPVAPVAPIESDYLREISASWGTAPVAPVAPIESDYLREIAAGW